MLLASRLKELIQELIDQEFSGFKGFPESIDLASSNWANLFKEYILDLSIPLAGSSLTLINQLELDFKNILLLQLQNQNITPIDLSIPITSFIAGVSSNITLLGVFTSTPPTIALDLSTCFLTSPKFEGTSELVSLNLSNTIDTWVKTAIAVNNTTGVQVNWG